jgi:hypothetical protein
MELSHAAECSVEVATFLPVGMLDYPILQNWVVVLEFQTLLFNT